MRTKLSTEDLGDPLEQPIGPAAVEGMVAGYPEPGVIIRLAPDRVRAWDLRDSYPAT
jgi:hypothetical protein